jgi:hypothetical protein
MKRKLLAVAAVAAVAALGLGCRAKLEGASYSGQCNGEFTKFDFFSKDVMKVTEGSVTRYSQPMVWSLSYKFDGKLVQIQAPLSQIWTATLEAGQLTTDYRGSKCVLRHD